VGRFAYERAGDLAPHTDQPALAPVLSDLAGRFVAFSDVLTDVAVASALGSAVDLVKLYDAFKRSKSPSALAAMAEGGVFPADVDGEA
jgi:hypothetical protein